MKSPSEDTKFLKHILAFDISICPLLGGWQPVDTHKKSFAHKLDILYGDHINVWCIQKVISKLSWGIAKIQKVKISQRYHGWFDLSFSGWVFIYSTLLFYVYKILFCGALIVCIAVLLGRYSIMLVLIVHWVSFCLI